MNVHTPLLVSTLCAALALSSAAGAAPETATPPQAGTPAAATPTTAPPAVAPHNHMAEKLGTSASHRAPGEAAAPHDKDDNAIKRHNHQRDMK